MKNSTTTRKLINLQKKIKGTSPVIATILLIGLVVIAGGMLYTIGITFLTSENPITIKVSDEIVFSTTETSQLDAYIDKLRIQISNPSNDPVEIDLESTYIYNATNNQRLYQWESQQDNSKPILFPQQGMTLEFRTAADQNIEELLFGEQIYLEFNISRTDEDETKIVTSKTYTVSNSNSLPVFDIVPVNSYTQSGTTVYFEALPNQTITVNLSVALWNRGNPSESHTKSISLFLENDTFFELSPDVKTQTVTIPSSNSIGTGDTCVAGQPCTIVNFPLTRINLTAMGINGINATYGAILAVSGEDFFQYTLNITSPRLVSMILPDALIASGSGSGRISNSNLIFNGPFNSNNSLELTLTVWNGDDETLNANMYLGGFNTTAFALETPNITSISIPVGTIPDSLDVCNLGDPCVTVSWTITRLPLKLNGQPTGVATGAYNILVSFIEFGTNLPIVLFINGPGNEDSPYMYVQSVLWDDKYNANQNSHDLSSTIEIWDKNFNTVGSATVSAIWTYPDLSTQALTGSTTGNGKITFTENDAVTGIHKITITNVSKTGNIYDPSRNTISNNESSYEVSTQYVYVLSDTWIFTAGTGKKVDKLELQLVINDQTDNGIDGADVTIDWTDPTGTTSQYLATTSTNKGTKGTAIFTLSSPASGTHSANVTDVSYSTYSYAPSENVATLPTSTSVEILFELNKLDDMVMNHVINLNANDINIVNLNLNFENIINSKFIYKINFYSVLLFRLSFKLL